MNILPGTMHEQVWKDDEEESDFSSEAARDEEEYYDSEEGDDESDEEEDDIIIDAATESSRRQWDDGSEEKCNIEHKVKFKSKKRSVREEINDLNDRLNLNDPNSTPQPNELMNQFFSRTAKYWMALDIENHEMEKAAAAPPPPPPRGGGEEFSEKEVRRRAFKLAEARYMELQPMLERLDKLEKQQRELEEARVNNRDIDSQRRKKNERWKKKDLK